MENKNALFACVNGDWRFEGFVDMEPDVLRETMLRIERENGPGTAALYALIAPRHRTSYADMVARAGGYAPTFLAPGAGPDLKQNPIKLAE